MRQYVLAAMVCLLASTWAHGQISSYTISAGYSNIQISHNAGLFYSRDGGYADGEVLWRLPNISFPLLLGGSISGSSYGESEHVPVTFTDGTPGFVRLYSDQGLVAFEGRAAVPFSFGSRGDTGFFVVPKLGAGLLIDTYAIDRIVPSSNGLDYIHTSWHDGAAFDIRPGIQGGYSWGWGSAGIEASYMAAFGDFGRLGSIAQEVRIGAFFRVKF